MDEILNPDFVIYLFQTKMHLRDCIRLYEASKQRTLKSVHLPEQVPIDIARENSRIVDKYISDSRRVQIVISLLLLHHAASHSRFTKLR